MAKPYSAMQIEMLPLIECLGYVFIECKEKLRKNERKHHELLIFPVDIFQKCGRILVALCKRMSIWLFQELAARGIFRSVLIEFVFTYRVRQRSDQNNPIPGLFCVKKSVKTIYVRWHVVQGIEPSRVCDIMSS